MNRPQKFARVLPMVAGLVAAVLAAATPELSARARVIIPLDAHIDSTQEVRSLRPSARYGVYASAPRLILFAPNAADEASDNDAEDDADEFDLADQDGDGYLSFREARRANPDWARNFRRIDTSGDGFLTREELDAFYAAAPVQSNEKQR